MRDAGHGPVMNVPLWAWLAFAATVAIMLAIDLLAHRGARAIGLREAAAWSAVWVSVALGFALVLSQTAGRTAGVDFTTAWLLEKSLSVDNLFVFALIFGYFKVPRAYQHRVLFFGVIGALVLRAILLSAGVAIVNRFAAVLFVFGAILVWSAVKLLRDNDDSVDPGKSLAVRALRRIMPISDSYDGTKFVVKRGGRRIGTPLLAVVVAVEAADLLFAVDSVPAVLAVSDEPFIVFTSNAFAILGLRSLYFLLAGALDRFHYLGKALSLILGFIGAKLFLQAGHKTISSSIPELPSLLSLGVIVAALTVAVVASLRYPRATSYQVAAKDGGEPLGIGQEADVSSGEPGDRDCEALSQRCGRALRERALGRGSGGDVYAGAGRLDGSEVGLVERDREQSVGEEALSCSDLLRRRGLWGVVRDLRRPGEAREREESLKGRTDAVASVGVVDALECRAGLLGVRQEQSQRGLVRNKRAHTMRVPRDEGYPGDGAATAAEDMCWFAADGFQDAQHVIGQQVWVGVLAGVIDHTVGEASWVVGDDRVIVGKQRREGCESRAVHRVTDQHQNRA